MAEMGLKFMSRIEFPQMLAWFSFAQQIGHKLINLWVAFYKRFRNAIKASNVVHAASFLYFTHHLVYFEIPLLRTDYLNLKFRTYLEFISPKVRV